MLSKVSGEIAYPFPIIDSFTLEVLEWISEFVLYFIMDVIICLYWD